MTLSDKMRVKLLGPASVDLISSQNKEVDGVVKGVPRFRSQRTIGLLGYLVAKKRPVAREILAALFWPDEELSRGRANLSRELHNLAQILPGCWDSKRQAVAFVPSEDITVDLYQLEYLEIQELWEEAAGLLGGEFLEGLSLNYNPELENWLLVERERWQRISHIILTEVARGFSRRGQYADALKFSQRQLQLAPWNEKAHVQVMRLLAWTDQPGAALKQFETCKQALKKELDVDPSPETFALYKKIQAGELAPPPQLPAFLTGEKARHEYSSMPFVGREDEMTKLDNFLGEVLDGKSQIVFISGGPGRGKTTLLEAYSKRAMENHQNLLVASGKCNAYSGVGDPYLPFLEILSMLTGDVESRWDAGALTQDHAHRLWDAFPVIVQDLLTNAPHLIDVFVPGQQLLSRVEAVGDELAESQAQLRDFIDLQKSRNEQVEQSHLFQQFARVLFSISKSYPLMLILDDLQWADTATISLLFHLGRQLSEYESRLMIACAYRPEEVSVIQQGKRHPLAKFLSEFKRTYGDIWVDLGRYDDEKDRRFVDTLLDIEPNRLAEGFRAALFDRTRGHPLFTIELLRAMQDRGDLLRDPDNFWIEGPSFDWEQLPVRVEAVIEERVGCLDPELQEILTVSSVEGEAFTAQVVAEVQNVSERSILRLLSQDLERRYRLVIDQGELGIGSIRISRYSFSHILFRDFLYKKLGQGERKLLHGAVAAALENLYEGQQNEIAGRLAHHYSQAGDPEHAFQYYCLAGDRAALMFASREAITHYSSAIQLADGLKPDLALLISLHRGRGLAYGIVGEYEQARTDLESALQISKEAEKHQAEWRNLLDLGRLWSAHNHNQALGYFKSALELARRLDDPAVLAGSLNWMGNWHMNDDNYIKAVGYHQEALQIFEDLGGQSELVNTLDLLGIAYLMGGDLGKSVQFYNQAIDIVRELDNRQRLASSLMGRATTYSLLTLLVPVPVSLPRDSVLDIEEAFQLAREADLASENIWVKWSLGLQNILCGDFGQALENLQTGLEFAQRIEHREWEVAVRLGLGILFLELFSPDEARKHLEIGLSLASELQSLMWTNLSSGALAAVYLAMGEPESARECLDSVISPDTLMDTLGLRYCWLRQAELALVMENADLAMDIINRLIQTAPGISSDSVITYLWMLKGVALAVSGLIEEALPLLLSTLENAEKVGERFLLWQIHARLGKLYQILGYWEEAEREKSSACAIIDELATTIPDETMRKDFLNGAYKKIH